MGYFLSRVERTGDFGKRGSNSAAQSSRSGALGEAQPWTTDTPQLTVVESRPFSSLCSNESSCACVRQ
jgi:hypothetical protein